MADAALRSGFLLKEGQQVKNWKQRYFVLTSDRLRYFTDVPAQGELKGEILLRSDHVRVMPEFRTPEQEVDWKFCIKTPKRELKCAAPTDKEMQAWITAIRSAVKDAETQAESKRASVTGITHAQKEEKVHQDRVAQLRQQDRVDPAKLYGVVWQADTSVSHCTSCKKLFADGVEKHHCRFCGKIFCSFCSRFQLEHPNTPGQQQRACTKCFKKKRRHVKRDRRSKNGGTSIFCFACCSSAPKDAVDSSAAESADSEIVRSTNAASV